MIMLQKNKKPRFGAAFIYKLTIISANSSMTGMLNKDKRDDIPTSFAEYSDLRL